MSTGIVRATLLASATLISTVATAQPFDADGYDYCQRAELQTSGAVSPYMTAALLDVALETIVDDGVAIVAYETAIGRGQTVASTLGELGFAADEINMNLVARLNPTIANLDDIDQGKMVRFPRFDARSEESDTDYIRQPQVDGFLASTRYVDIIQDQATQDITATLDAGESLNTMISGQLMVARRDAAQVGFFGTQATIDQMALVNGGIYDFDRSWSDTAVQPVARVIMPSFTTPELDQVYTQAMVDNRPRTSSNFISVTVRTFVDGQPIDQLEIRYRNKMLDQLGCPLEFHRTFQTRSHEAQQSLPSANFVIWAVDETTDRRSEPMDLNLTAISGREFPEDFHIVWVNE